MEDKAYELLFDVLGKEIDRLNAEIARMKTEMLDMKREIDEILNKFR